MFKSLFESYYGRLFITVVDIDVALRYFTINVLLWRGSTIYSTTIGIEPNTSQLEYIQ